MYRLFKKPFFSRFQKTWRWPENYKAIDSWEEITFQSESKSMISGLYGASTNSRIKGNIVCAHPMGISAKGYFLKRNIADQLRKEGFNILLFDFNGFGNSTDGDLNLPADVYGAGKYIQQKYPQLKLGIFGISFGASMSICSFSREDNPYTSAVFESAFTSLREFWAHFGLLGQFIKLFPILLPAMERRMNALYNTPMIKNTKEILWIHGAEDIQTPPEMGIRFEQSAPLISERWIVPKGKHADCFDQNPEEYLNKVITFFKRTLAS